MLSSPVCGEGREGGVGLRDVLSVTRRPCKKTCAGHRILALNRGEKEKFLTVKVAGSGGDRSSAFWNKMVIAPERTPVTTPVLREVVADSYDRLIAPAIEREVRNRLDGEGGGRRHQGVRKEPGAASHAASNRRPRRLGMGSGVPYRM